MSPSPPAKPHPFEILTTRIRQSAVAKIVMPLLPPLNFITLHYLYIITTCLLASAIFHLACADPDRAVPIAYVDSLFLVVSAMTEAGLNTVNLSEVTTAQQVVLWVLIVAGGSIFVSISTLWGRGRAFRKGFRDVGRRGLRGRSRGGRGRRRRGSLGKSRVRGGGEEGVLNIEKEMDGDGRLDGSRFESRHSGPRDPTTLPSPGSTAAKLSGQGDHLPGTKEGVSDDPDRISIAHSVSREGPNPFLTLNLSKPQTTSSINPPADIGLSHRSIHYQDDTATEKEKEAEIADSDQPYYLNRHTTGRNARFHDLTKAEREHLGGVEYRALTFLSILVPVYWFLWQLLGCLGLAFWFARYGKDVTLQNGINPWWLGVFNGASAFNNSGMSLLDANMIPFRTSVYPLITMGLMILAGNTAYPLFLRLICWTILKLLNLTHPSPTHHPKLKSTLTFILRYPRRVYTNLFPSTATWYLLFALLILNGTDWIAFEVLNIGNPAVTAIPPNFRVLDGLFQALAVRAGGFYIIAIPSLRIGLQVLYVVMMYISAYPVVITMRHSNVYEERSLGIYADDNAAHHYHPADETHATKNTILTRLLHPLTPAPTTSQRLNSRFLTQQIRTQLAHDIWLLVLATLIIAVIETSSIERDPVTYSVFNIVFEVVSAYGCVGISTGLPDRNYSFSGGWRTASKLVLCVVMVRGRHRGLPVALDRAVRLGGEVEGEDGEEGEREWGHLGEREV